MEQRIRRLISSLHRLVLAVSAGRHLSQAVLLIACMGALTLGQCNVVNCVCGTWFDSFLEQIARIVGLSFVSIHMFQNMNPLITWGRDMPASDEHNNPWMRIGREQ